VFNETLERLHEIVGMDLYERSTEIVAKPDGSLIKKRHKKLNVRLIKEIRLIADQLALRVQGAVIQKVAVKQHVTTEQIGYDTRTGMAEVLDIDELERTGEQLRRITNILDGKIARAGGDESVIDAVTVSSSEATESGFGEEEENSF